MDKKRSLHDAGIPKYQFELCERHPTDAQWWYTDSVGHKETAKIGHFITDSDATAMLELPTEDQAKAVAFALNNPHRMLLVMEMCGVPKLQRTTDTRHKCSACGTVLEMNTIIGMVICPLCEPQTVG